MVTVKIVAKCPNAHFPILIKVWLHMPDTDMNSCLLVVLLEVDSIFMTPSSTPIRKWPPRHVAVISHPFRAGGPSHFLWFWAAP